MSKKPQHVAIESRMNENDGGGCGFCLLNLSLMLAAPAAVVALIVKGKKSR